MDIQLCCFLAGIYVCVHLFVCQNKSVFSEIQVFKCFLCACTANDAGHKATGDRLQELAVKRLVYTNKAKRNCLLACLSGMAGHALYGIAPCFGHTRVTFDAENDRSGPGSLRGHLQPPK